VAGHLWEREAAEAGSLGFIGLVV